MRRTYKEPDSKCTGSANINVLRSSIMIASEAKGPLSKHGKVDRLLFIGENFKLNPAART